MENKNEATSVIKKEKVRECLQNLRDEKIHRHFHGYLCVKKKSHEKGNRQDMSISFKKFFDEFLRVPGGPEGYPYVYAFVEHEPNDGGEDPTSGNEWYNKNTAGSYAPSSIREEGPFRKVVRIEGSGNDITYSLRDNHWELARKHLAYESKVPAVELAVVLYRDHGIRKRSPTISDWVRRFQSEFGYLDESGETTDEFEHLYLNENNVGSLENWFTQVNGNST